MDLTSRASTLAPPRLGRAMLHRPRWSSRSSGSAILAVGSRQPRVPAPFGPARNGVLVSSADGDIYLVDPRRARQLAPDRRPDVRLRPGVLARRDEVLVPPRGTGRLRKPDCGLILVVANADGTGVRELTPGVPCLDALDWSPDGTQIAILTAAEDGQRPCASPSSTRTAAACGRSTSAGRSTCSHGCLPDGGEIVVRGEQLSDDAPPPGIFAVRPDGSGLREISTRPAVDANDFKDISVSPDGTRIGYRGDDGPGGLFRSHVLDLRTGADRVLPRPDGAGPVRTSVLPDGQAVAYLRGLAGNRVQLVVAPADGSSTGNAIGPAAPLGADGPDHQRLRLLARRQGSDRQLRRRASGAPPADRWVAGIRSSSAASWPSRAYQRLAP